MFNAPSSSANPTHDGKRLRACFFITLIFTLLLWLIKISESLLGFSLVEFGIYPLQLDGLPGILLAPLIHGSYAHLTANSLPLVILGSALLYGYPKSARLVIPVIYLGSGLSVWLFAREAWHIGASGLTFGFMFFVFTVGILRWDRKAIAISMIVFFLYGGMLVGV